MHSVVHILICLSNNYQNDMESNKLKHVIYLGVNMPHKYDVTAHYVSFINIFRIY